MSSSTAAGVPSQPADFVFERAPGSGKPLPPDLIGQAWYRLCRELGVKACLHDLRHLQASLLLDASEAVTTVAARPGHRETSTTLKFYDHLMPRTAVLLVARATEGRSHDAGRPGVGALLDDRPSPHLVSDR